MRVAGSYDCETLQWGTPLSRAHARGALAGDLRAPGIRDAAPDATRPAPARELVEALAREPGAGNWSALLRSGARCVVTGQQPGAAGGPALVLYKIATAVVLAGRLSQSGGVPVVPVFWNATDDEDFEEIARSGWLDAAGRLLFLELERGVQPGWVGDLPAAGDTRAAEAVLGTGHGGMSWPARAADHGAWVAEFVTGIFPELAVVDARCAALRTHAAPLFERYLRDPAAAQANIEAQIAALVAAGFDRTLAPGSLRSGLFLTPERRREKPGADLEPLWTALRTAPQTLSPNVLLRALVQDFLLPSVAHVVGPGEIGYLIELRSLRAAWDIPEPALVPRLSATLVPAAQWDAVQRAGVDPYRGLLAPGPALEAAGAARTAAHAAAAAAEFEPWPARLAAWGIAPAAQGKVLKRLRAVQEEIAVVLGEQGRDALLAEWPALRAFDTTIRPRGRAQERVLGALWARHVLGVGTRVALLEWAGAHLDRLAAHEAEHFVATYEGTTA